MAGLWGPATQADGRDLSQGPRALMDAEAFPTGRPLPLRNGAGFIRRAQIFIFLCRLNTKIKTVYSVMNKLASP